ncbi:hypothetical protein G3N55_00760 [Dissulfurirhabdus thermomarina]|uniref:DUF948 domain-containing protein n=1 Tax=Dissulfurirhabdus thermomarina TaxID=1765737 RepID=A0A6N9TJE8_DISTH|nr:hypothetical protein [Dissulfurirhabdus thermomarina]NDY41382.1 hypothetical protein [Dissulfurirhabdus thermomarina]NMX23602.1 hypothetical protein [Dissulfurirhabdus thermomarina]
MGAHVSDILLLVIALSVAVLAAAVAVLALRLRDTLKRVDELTSSTQILVEETGRRLNDLVDSVERLSRLVEEQMERNVAPLLEGLAELAGQVNRSIAQTRGFFDAFQEVGDTVRLVSRITRGGLSHFAVQVASMAMGAKRSLEVVSEKLTGKGGKET